MPKKLSENNFVQKKFLKMISLKKLSENDFIKQKNLPENDFVKKLSFDL